MPQPVTSVTGFAMTGDFTWGAIKRVVREADPYALFTDRIS